MTPAGDAGRVEVRIEVRPRWPFAMPRRLGMDRLARRHGEVLHRLIHVAGEPVVIRAVQLSADRVLFGAQASSEELARSGIARMRRALGIDLDLRAVSRAVSVRSSDRPVGPGQPAAASVGAARPV